MRARRYRVYPDRAAGRDRDHRPGECRGAAGGLAGPVAPPGQRGGPDRSRHLGRRRDSALHSGTPSGIRLLPDPAFPLVYLPNGQIDPTQPLAANRIIPIESAPEYSEGQVSIVIPNALSTTTNAYSLSIPYPQLNGGGYYPSGGYSARLGSTATTGNVLMVKEIVAAGNVLNEPTSWFWNIRVGDKLQLNGSGIWYTVVGPMVVTPQQGNSELFVNVGPPGSQSPLGDTQAGTSVFPEFLFLVNGIDDNKNGWTDEGYDGVDNNFSQEVCARRDTSG